MIKVGVIGLGSMGKNHARVCSEIKNIELVGVSDIDKEAANRFNIKNFVDYHFISISTGLFPVD